MRFLSSFTHQTDHFHNMEKILWKSVGTRTVWFLQNIYNVQQNREINRGLEQLERVNDDRI